MMHIKEIQYEIKEEIAVSEEDEIQADIMELLEIIKMPVN